MLRDSENTNRCLPLGLMDRKTIFADVIVPLALPQLFTYRVPQFLNAEIRELQRVVVPFGKKKKYTAIIHHLHETPPANYEARYIESVLDAEPVLNTFQLRFWTWISDYYMCSLGEVMQAALPAGLKLSSETIIKPYGVRDREHAGELTDREFLILDALEKTGQLSISDVEQIAGIKTVYPIIRGLIDKRMIIAEEEMNETFKQKTEICIGLNPEFEGEDGLNALLNQLNKAPKQQEVLLGFLSMNQAVTLNLKPVKRKELLAKVPGGLAPLNQLIKKGIFVSESRVVSRLSGDEQSIETVELSAAQEIALEQLHEGFAEKQTILLHGLTGSGKTELYIRLMSEQLAQGNQVLYLLPEIALTAQIINRLRKHFGRTVQVYHSRFSENERVEVWNAVSAAHPEGSVILGARSSVFLPFTKLGLIIVDEEHEPSFKQHEPAPRYQNPGISTSKI